MRRLPPSPGPLRAALALTTLVISLAAPLPKQVTAPIAAAQQPSLEQVQNLRAAFNAAQEGLPKKAEDLLSKAVVQWVNQPPDELAAVFKTRGAVRMQLGTPQLAIDDFTEAIRLLRLPEAQKADPAEVLRTYQLRARAHGELREWKEQELDLSSAIERLDNLPVLESTNPYLFAERSSARLRMGDYAGAAEDAEQAELDFGAIGEKIRRVTMGADKALSLYGEGREADAVSAMLNTFKKKGEVVSNNPDDIALLQELSRKDAELHLAYAAHLSSEGRLSEATRQWESGCIRLEAYVRDGQNRLQEEERLRGLEAAAAEKSGRESRLPARTAAANPFALGALLSGMDPSSPYLTQRPGQAYFWYKEGEGSIERRDVGNSLAEVDSSLSCARFRDSEWVSRERPEWPDNLRSRLRGFTRF